MRVIVCAALMVIRCAAAGIPPPILAAASKGQTAQVKALLDGGAKIEATDHNGRTALMLAAQHGHVDTVRLLLARGADPEARDESGFTAWAVAMFDSAGHGDHEAVLKLLPHPPRFRVALFSGWTPAKLASSCFMNRDRLEREVGLYRLDIPVLDEFARYAASAAARDLIEIVAAEKTGKHLPAASEATLPSPAPDALVTFEVEPGTACAGGGDNVTLSIDVRVYRAGDRTMLFEHAFAGGVKGLRVQPVNNPRQYEPVWQAWIKPQGEPEYWAVAAALARATWPAGSARMP
jgi:Ankyrin repeats (3 copies)